MRHGEVGNFRDAHRKLGTEIFVSEPLREASETVPLGPMVGACAGAIHVHVRLTPRLTGGRDGRGSMGSHLRRPQSQSRDISASKRVGRTGTAVRATEDSASFNQVMLQAGPLLLPLALSTSAAVYRSMSKRTEGGFKRLPFGMWAGIGLVWCYWAGSQNGIF